MRWPVLILSFLWFYFPGEYVLIANQDNKIFITSLEYFFSFLDQPGGILEYLGNFLTQFFRFRLIGALILSGVITLSYLATIQLIIRASGRKGFLIAGILTPVLLIGMHHTYPHHVYHSLGFIIAMVMAAFLPEDKRGRKIFLAISIPIIYFVCGGYLWAFCVIVLALYVAGNKRPGLEIIFLTIIYPAILVIPGVKFVYLYPIKELIIQPFPHDVQYVIPFMPYILVMWIILLTIFASIYSRWKPENPVWRKPENPVWRILPATILLISGLLLIFNVTYNKKNVEFFNIERFAVSEDWDGLLRYTNQHPSTNLFGSFYTNMALVHNSKLCSELFNYPQPFGIRGLCFEWEAKDEILKRGSDFFWTINFVNEAHHWAFEYLMALFLLETEVDEIAAFLPDYLELNDGKLPVMLDESLLVHNIIQRENALPDIQVSQNTLMKFEDYSSQLRRYRNPKDAARALYPAYKNSFWFYMNFSKLPTQ